MHTNNLSLRFAYHKHILRDFPAILGGVVLAEEISNSPAPETLQTLFLAEQKAILERNAQTLLSEMPTLAAWRRAFRQFGTDPTKYRSACEALLRRLVKKGYVPTINTLVDICNLVSIRYGLPVAAFDLSHVQGMIRVQYATGSEVFIPHDQPEGENPEPGEVIFIDESGKVHARRWCWKQSAQSSVDLKTTRAMITVEAQHPASQPDIQAALQDLLGLLSIYARGRFEIYTMPGNQGL